MPTLICYFIYTIQIITFIKNTVFILILTDSIKVFWDKVIFYAKKAEAINITINVFFGKTKAFFMLSKPHSKSFII